MPECEYVCALIDRSGFIPVQILKFSTAREHIGLLEFRNSIQTSAAYDKQTL